MSKMQQEGFFKIKNLRFNMKIWKMKAILIRIVYKS